MPAAAVIPAPIAYIKVVAVKKLVVEPWAWGPGGSQGQTRSSSLYLGGGCEGGALVKRRPNWHTIPTLL